MNCNLNRLLLLILQGSQIFKALFLLPEYLVAKHRRRIKTDLGKSVQFLLLPQNNVCRWLAGKIPFYLTSSIPFVRVISSYALLYSMLFHNILKIVLLRRIQHIFQIIFLELFGSVYTPKIVHPGAVRTPQSTPLTHTFTNTGNSEIHTHPNTDNKPE